MNTKEAFKDIDKDLEAGSITEPEAEMQRAYVLSRSDDAPVTDPMSGFRDELLEPPPKVKKEEKPTVVEKFKKEDRKGKK